MLQPILVERVATVPDHRRERRFRAAQRAGLQRYGGDPTRTTTTGLPGVVENIQREDLPPSRGDATRITEATGVSQADSERIARPLDRCQQPRLPGSRRRCATRCRTAPSPRPRPRHTMSRIQPSGSGVLRTSRVFGRERGIRGAGSQATHRERWAPPRDRPQRQTDPHLRECSSVSSTSAPTVKVTVAYARQDRVAFFTLTIWRESAAFSRLCRPPEDTPNVRLSEPPTSERWSGGGTRTSQLRSVHPSARVFAFVQQFAVSSAHSIPGPIAKTAAHSKPRAAGPPPNRAGKNTSVRFPPHSGCGAEQRSILHP